ncbi:MAG: hypothetical protein RLZZ293_25 [Pseudomonadota bacterium]|jgi:CRISPR system Cascade subunit CasD
MNDPYLLLWFEAPLQSWGVESKFGRRDTLNFPTKSGVLGLICSALGLSGEQKDFLASFADLDMQIISYAKTNSELVQLPLRDFHMVGSGYDDKDPWQSLLIPKKSDGGKSVGGGSKITYRYYLQDAVFAVLLQVPQDKSSLLSVALQNPIWDIYLGRKNCIPTELIYRGIFTHLSEALNEAEQLSMNKNYYKKFTVIQGEHGDDKDSIISLNDVPLQFGEYKLYRDRLVTIIQEEVLDGGE